MPEKTAETGPTVSSITHRNRSSGKRVDIHITSKRKIEQACLRTKLRTRKSNDDARARRAKKLEQRKREKKAYTAQDWAAPAPTNLVAKLDIPKSKYQSYFEFADNPEKKEKRLEFKVTNDVLPPPGYVFVPIGDPALTNACKELSREKDVMIFIVTTCKEEQSKISEQVYRIGFHFREIILDEVREFLGERLNYNSSGKGCVDPIPESQQEINKQADAAIRDLFPRIPNTDRQMVIEHAFKKGAMYQGEPTVGMQPNIPLSRRVQLAVLAHIRHNHTRYDKLLRETSWINARKLVEPVCLDIILKWRGDEETGRDQMDEILREVVIITDSESEDEDSRSSSKIDSSNEEGEVTSRALSEPVLQSSLEGHPHNIDSELTGRSRHLSPRNNSSQLLSVGSKTSLANKKPRTRPAHRGFKRYRAAWKEALHRQQQVPCSPQYRVISDNEFTRRNYTENSCPLARSSAHERINLDSVKHTPCYYLEDREKRSDQNFTLPSYTHTFHHSNTLEPRPRRSPVIENLHSERPIHVEDSMNWAGTNTYSALGRNPPHVVARNSLQDIPLKSIETTSNEIASPHAIEKVSDRFNYIQDSHYGRSGGLKHHTPARHEVIIIDDDSPQAGSRRMVYHNQPSRSKYHSVHSQDFVTASQNSDSHLTTMLSVQPKEFVSRYSNISSKFVRGSSYNARSRYLGHASTLEIPNYDCKAAKYISSHYRHTRGVEPGHLPKSRIEFVDLTSQDPTPIYDKHIYQQINEPNLGEHPRETRVNCHESFKSGHHRCPSPTVPVSPQARGAFGAAPLLGVNRDFGDEASYFHLSERTSRARNDSTRVPHRLSNIWTSHQLDPPYTDHPVLTDSSLSTRERSPVYFVERPRHAPERNNEALYYYRSPKNHWDHPRQGEATIFNAY